MPRKHRRLDRHRPETAPPAPPALAALEAALRGALRGLGGGLSGRQRQQLRHRWSQATPQLVPRLAALLDEEPLLRALPFSGETLRQRLDRVGRLFMLRELLAQLSDVVADLLLQEKAALHGQVELGLRAIGQLVDGPLTDPAAAHRLRAAAEPMRQLLLARRAAIARKKRERLAQRAGRTGQALPEVLPSLQRALPAAEE